MIAIDILIAQFPGRTGLPDCHKQQSPKALMAASGANTVVTAGVFISA